MSDPTDAAGHPAEPAPLDRMNRLIDRGLAGRARAAECQAAGRRAYEAQRDAIWQVAILDGQLVKFRLGSDAVSCERVPTAGPDEHLGTILTALNAVGVIVRADPTTRTRWAGMDHGAQFERGYTHAGRPGNYHPDLIVKIADGRGDKDMLNLVVEVSGQKKTDKEAKVETARTLWVPAVNNERRFGRWAFLEIDNPDKAMQAIRAFLACTRL